jgi:hypothetical protein
MSPLNDWRCPAQRCTAWSSEASYPTVRIGTAVRVPVQAIERWVADQTANQGGGL